MECTCEPKCKFTAEQLYFGTTFRYSLDYARLLPVDKIFVISAKHHLLPMDKAIEWYDYTLKRKCAGMKKAWAMTVINQLRDNGFDLDTDEFMILAEKDYYQYLNKPTNIEKNYLKRCYLPLQHIWCSGGRKNWLKNEICRVQALSDAERRSYWNNQGWEKP
jgi:hypothetical protein